MTARGTGSGRGKGRKDQESRGPDARQAFQRTLREAGPETRFPTGINDLIRRRLDLPSKEREGFLRFLCPHCNEFHTATNPRTNLARCFRCGLSFNPIEMVMAVKDCGFVDAVQLLIPLLEARAPARGGEQTAPRKSDQR